MSQKIGLSGAFVAVILVQLIAPTRSYTGPLGNALTGFIGIADGLAQSTLQVVNTGIDGLTDATRDVLNTGDNVMSIALQGTGDLAKQGIDVATSLVKIINLPGVDPIATTADKVAKTVVNWVDVLGQTSLGKEDFVINKTADTVTGLSQAGNVALSGRVSEVADHADDGVNDALDLVDGGTSKIGKAIDRGMDAMSPLHFIGTVLG